MPRKYVKKSDNGPQQYDLQTIIHAVKAVLINNKSQRSTATIYSMARSSLQRYLSICVTEFGANLSSVTDKQLENVLSPMSALGKKPIFNSDQENTLVKYIIEYSKPHYGLTINNIRVLALKFAKKIAVPYPEGWNVAGMASKDWCYSFVARSKCLALRTQEKTRYLGTSMSGTKCKYINCGKSPRNTPGLKLHRFPIDVRISKKWIENCGNGDLLKLSPKKLRGQYICKNHFAKTCYKSSNLKRLRTDAVPENYNKERVNYQTTLPDPRTAATFSTPGMQDVLEMGSVGIQSRNPNVEESETILDTIVIKEEIPDDEDVIGLDLECENVMDVDIKPEPETEPTVLNLLSEVQPVDFNILQPEPIIKFANLTNTIKTSFSANIKKKPSTVVTATETRATPSILSFTNADTESHVDSSVTPNQRAEAAVSETVIEMCILCAKTFNHPLKDVSLLEKRILYTVDLNIKKLQVPKKACENCITRLKLSHTFKRQVAQATKLLTQQFEMNVLHKQLDKLDHSKGFTEKNEEETVGPCLSVPTPEEPTFEYIVCDSEFLTHKNLQSHDLLENTKMGCKECDYKTNDLKEYLDHKKFHATKAKRDKTRVICEKCGATVTGLKYDATKMVECSNCNSSVPDTVSDFNISGINKIKDIRHNIKDYGRTFLCKICDKRFSDQKRLENHVHLHSGEKPFACPVCDRRFNKKHNLGTHLRIHTNTFPYKCNYCKESFRNNVSKNDHQKYVHPKEWEENKNIDQII